MLSQKPDDLAGGSEQEAHDRANQPRQQRTEFHGDIFEAISQSFAGGFQTSGKGPNDSSDCGPGGDKNSGQGYAIFLEDLFHPFKERPPLSLSVI